MEALFLGSDGQQVFAAYHPAAATGTRPLTVICPPLFMVEYIRSHLALRQLAISLAENGYPVLRFDYRGTGDSFGDIGDVSMSDWLEDTDLALREGLELSGSSKVRLLGVRAGALVACRFAGRCKDIERVILWDPVLDGPAYLESLRHIQTQILERDLDLSPSERRETAHEYGGQRLSAGMLLELRALNASAFASVRKDNWYVVTTSSQPDFAVHGVAGRRVDFGCGWETDFQNVMTPKPVLEHLAECLTML
jgi:pimeloyl-ACP methyl ester carboxylesterase